MSAVHIGQKIICIDDRPHPAHPGPRTDEAIPRKGSVYTVREIVLLKHLGAHDDGVLVHEIVNAPRTYDTPVGLVTAELSFAVSRFRPAASIDVFLRILEQAAPVRSVKFTKPSPNLVPGSLEAYLEAENAPWEDQGERGA